MEPIEHKIFVDRDGGQNALRGYNYQTLFSTYLALKKLKDKNSYLKLEGFEDIDQYTTKEKNKIVHIQIKFSINKQDASFMRGVLKNFLEVYLMDNKKDRYFHLVYDFKVAKGNLSKLIEDPMNLDNEVKKYWKGIIDEIKEENPMYSWENYNFNDFMSRLIFTNYNQEDILTEIKKILIIEYQIASGNENLFINSIFYMCFQKMKNRDKVRYKDLANVIQNVKDDISKGEANKALNWITKINFDAKNKDEASEYYRGKKAEVSDIVNGYPVVREEQELKIIESINKNDITVIKSSSGQGKTTLLWRASYILKDEYYVYHLHRCHNTDDVGNIIKYLKGRISVGEKTILALDNLNFELKAWNMLAMRMKEEIGCNYKIVLTTREDDWYHFAGDQSRLRNISIVQIALKIEEAKEIYNELLKQGHVKNDMPWQSAWEKVKDRALLIEYIYLLTQGDMLSERIETQIKSIQESQYSEVIQFVLRHICFTDMYGIKLSISLLSKKVISVFNEIDITYIFNSIENEFHIRFEEEKDYIVGLHPVRSQHISEQLHRYYPIEKTILSLIDVIDKKYIAVFFSNILIELKDTNEEFYINLIEYIGNKDYIYLFETLKGVFGGTVLKYYNKNKYYFDEAYNLGGLELILMEINPFTKFDEFNTEVKTLKQINKIFPNNKNVKKLINLANQIEPINLNDTDIYIFSYYLYQNLKNKPIKIIKKGYADIVYWLIKINPNFSLLDTFSFKDVLKNEDEWSFYSFSLLMLSWYIVDLNAQLKFSEKYKLEIFSRLKRELYLVDIYENNSNIVSKYISSNLVDLNEKSVDRIEAICKTLPIYKEYHIEVIKPEIEPLNKSYSIPNDDFKQMPIENIVNFFHRDFVNIWNNSILTFYDFDTIYEYLYHWLNIRKKILSALRLVIVLYEQKYKKDRITKGKASEFDNLKDQIRRMKKNGRGYPLEHKPFIEEEISISKPVHLEKYFFDIENFFNQFVEILMGEDSDKVKRATLNLQSAFSNLDSMQQSYYYEANKLGYLTEEHGQICKLESKMLIRVMNYTLFFNNKKNGKYIDQRLVDSWVKDYWNNYFTDIENNVLELKELKQYNFRYILPNKLIYQDVLKIFPIVVESELSLMDNLEEFIQAVIPLIYISEKDIEFIVLILKQKYSNIVEPYGLRFNIEFFKEMKTELDDKDPDFEYLTPYSISISREMLNVFDQDFTIGKNTIENFYSPGVEEFILKLWEYSMFNQYFKIITDKDAKYFEQINYKYETEIYMLKNKLESEDIERVNFDKLILLSNRVLKGNYLTNNELNSFLNNYNNLE